MKYDMVIQGGTVVTAADVSRCDVAVRDGRIAALGEDLAGAVADGGRVVDAAGKLVLPGGIDSHCHIEQLSASGFMTADDFWSATVSAAFGGTTTVIPFAAQHRGQSLREVVEEYHARAGPKAVIDYAFHLIISDATPQVLGQELPGLIRDGYTSFKVYMTYELLRLDDYSLLNVLALARREGAMVMVHAENYEMIRWLTDRLLEAGNYQAKFPRDLARGAGRGRGDGAGHLALGADGRPDPGGPRLDRAGRGGESAPRAIGVSGYTGRPARSTSSSPRTTSTGRGRRERSSAAARRRVTKRITRRCGGGS